LPGNKTGAQLTLEKPFQQNFYADTTTLVGASLLAMVVNDNALCLTPRGVSVFFASKLAPTEVLLIYRI